MKFRQYTLLALAMLASSSMAQVKKAATAKPAVAAKTAKVAANVMSPRAKALFEDMLPNTQKIFIIDSAIVDKDNVLSAIPLPKDYGRYVDYDTFFGKTTGKKSFVFVNGFGNRCYYTEAGADSISRLYMRDKLGDGWGKPVAIKEVNDRFTDISYPYMSSDGQTLYFAGVSNDDGLGKRDIYMTKYDADEGTFMTPENIGLPFNSAADDYAFIIADAHRLAWFATTRRQHEGKACVYVFVPAEQRQNYSEDEIGRNKLISLANITRIRETWPTPEIRERAMARLNQLQHSTNTIASAGDNIAFVVNDDNTYTNADQFCSDDTRRQFFDLQRLQTDLDATLKKLDAMRSQYHAAPTADRKTLGQQIEQLEQKTIQLRQSAKEAAQDLRTKESNLLKNK